MEKEITKAIKSLFENNSEEYKKGFKDGSTITARAVSQNCQELIEIIKKN